MRVVCGKGNNGGDGLVAARLLREMGFEAEVLLLWPADELSDDAAANLKRLEGATEVGDDIAARARRVGRGRRRDLRHRVLGGAAGAGRARDRGDRRVKEAGAPVVACDIASGVDAATGEVAGAEVEADVTVTFHGAKVGHYVAPGKWATGELVVAPIGIPAGAPEPAAAGVIEPAVLDAAPRRGSRSTKFSSGQVTIAGGSRGLTGAVRMSSTAAIRAGAGYATVAVPADLEPIFEAAEVEVMSKGIGDTPGRLGSEAADELLAAFERAAAGVLGPGLGRDEDSLALAREVAPRIEAPLVIDADGLNAFAGQLDRLAARPAPTILTPHAGELGRLLERDSSEIGERRRRRRQGGGRLERRRRRPQGRRHDRHRRRAGRGQRGLGARPRDGGERRRPLRADRGAPRPRPRALRRRLRRGDRPRPRRAGGGPPRRPRRVGDRHRRDRRAPGGPAARRAGRITSPTVKTAAEIMDADAPSVTADEDARAAIDLLSKTELAPSRWSTTRARWSGSSASRT